MKQTFLALMKVAALLEEYDQLNDLLKQHSKYLDRAPARVQFEFLNLGNPHHVSVESTALADKLHYALRTEITKRIAVVEADLQRYNTRVGSLSSDDTVFPRSSDIQPGTWVIPYNVLHDVQSEVAKLEDSTPDLETIETILLAAEKYAQLKEETNGDT